MYDFMPSVTKCLNIWMHIDKYVDMSTHISRQESIIRPMGLHLVSPFLKFAGKMFSFSKALILDTVTIIIDIIFIM